MKKKLKFEEVQKNLGDVISSLEQNGGYVEVQKNNHTAAVILSSDEFKRLQRFMPNSSSGKAKKTDWKLAGSMELADDFDEFSSEPSKLILESIKKQKL